MMIPNDLLDRLVRIDRQLQAEEQTDQIKLARKGLDDAMFWIDKEKVRRVEDRRRRLEEKIEAQKQEGTTQP